MVCYKQEQQTEQDDYEVAARHIVSTPAVLNAVDRRLWAELHPNRAPIVRYCPTPSKKVIAKKNLSLGKFVKAECANFSQYYQACVWGEPCKVLIGEKCGYFERCVLCPPDYKFRLPGYDYSKLFAQYADQTDSETKIIIQRRCSCGNPLLPRHRYCDDCTRKKRKASNRKYNQRRAG
jgi:hypothetical protein